MPVNATTHPPVFDIHCPHCQQVFIPADRMKPLSNWKTNEPKSKELLVADIGTSVLTSGDFLCKNCGSMGYFRLNEQRLRIVLIQIGQHD